MKEKETPPGTSRSGRAIVLQKYGFLASVRAWVAQPVASEPNLQPQTHSLPADSRRTRLVLLLIPMNAADLNSALLKLVDKKHELAQLAYNDARYDDVEEELHDLGDSFNEEYGDYLEEALDGVHRRLRSDTDVLLPTAYLPATGAGAVPGPKEGVWIDSEEYPGTKIYLTLVPNPTRFLLAVGPERKEVWKHEAHPATH